MPDAAGEDLSLFCCQNPRCLAYGSRGGAFNLHVCGRLGKHKDIRLLKCHVCGRRFSERKGTVFYRSHLPVQTVLAILAHVQDGCGMRQTGRLEAVKADTVIRYATLAGRHARALHEHLLAFSPGHPGAAAR